MIISLALKSNSRQTFVYLHKKAQINTKLNNAVYSCFLDASKAFDRVKHWKLFNKLIIRQVPLLIVRMLIF